jgi:phage portal protein BeeE
VKVTEAVRKIWSARAGEAAALPALEGAGGGTALRKSAVLPTLLQPSLYPGRVLPKVTPANLRRFAETPVARRAINVIKDRVASLDWQVRLRRDVPPGSVQNVDEKLRALRFALEQPNGSDSFRTLLEQVLEDALVGGFGAIEMELTGDAARPFQLWAVDGATVQINTQWNGSPSGNRYAQVTGLTGSSGKILLADDELMYLRMNPRTHTPFGLGPLEVAFETVSSFLGAHRYAGKLASNAVMQYALWMNQTTPAEHDRLLRWWQDEIEGTGRVPILSTEQQPQVLRFAQGTDANRSTSDAQSDEMFRSAVVPLARLVTEHVTRDLFAKRLGWNEFEFVFNELEAPDELELVQIQIQLLGAGVLTVDEVRAMRGLKPLSVAQQEETAREQTLMKGGAAASTGVAAGT